MTDFETNLAALVKSTTLSKQVYENAVAVYAELLTRQNVLRLQLQALTTQLDAMQLTHTSIVADNSQRLQALRRLDSRLEQWTPTRILLDAVKGWNEKLQQVSQQTADTSARLEAATASVKQ
jgi:hypothetical protein